jgi:hypothetical protein
VCGAVVARVANASNLANGEGVSPGTTIWEIDGKVSGRASHFTNANVPQRSGCAPSSLAVAAEVVTRGGIPVKKIAVRVAAVTGGLVAVLLAGGAWVRG